MFSTIYFAVVSTLSSSNVPETVASRILSGQWQDALQAAARRADPEQTSNKPQYEDFQLHGDMQLALGCYEDAEETFRRAQKEIRGSRDAIRVTSCRNTGWQALFQNRFNVALNCFRRMVDEPSASLVQRLDGLVGMTLVLHQLGSIEAVCARLGELLELVGTAGPGWAPLIYALRRDLLTQYHLHCSERLADHIYWRSVVLDFLPRELGDINEPSPIGECAALPVLTQRLTYLEHLRALADGKNSAVEGIEQHIRWAAQTGLSEYRRNVCLEATLAAIAAHAPTVAQTMLQRCDGAISQGDQQARWYLDYLYSMAKVCQQQGRVQEFSQLYGRYAFASMRHVRADSVLAPLTAVQTPRNQPRPDDISARLPGKYRRAYRYMMDNLDQRNLSVREIASHIGVTERAIQAVFKNNLGLSPSQLIRRQRMERIHESLSDENVHVSSVLDIANRWGVQHRSTLINSYRKQFNEAPSETLAR